MSSIKVSALTAKTSPTGAEELLINDGGVSKKITIANLPDTNTTYSVGDGGLTSNNFTDDDHTKLNAIEASADVTDSTNVVAALTAGTNVTISAGGTIASTDTDTVYTHPNHSGDVTSTADGATVIAAGAVDIAMLSATGTAGATNFLRGDNSWVVPTDTDTVYTHPNHSGDVVSTADGATVIQVDAVDIPMLSATGTASSTTYLRGDNAWATVDALPSQATHAGKYLTTDATTATWGELDTDANTTTTGMYENHSVISANYSITADNNAMSAGPITVNSGITVTVPATSTWTIL